MNFSFDFSGKNVFVFGGTSGINLGIAESFAAARAGREAARQGVLGERAGALPLRRLIPEALPAVGRLQHRLGVRTSDSLGTVDRSQSSRARPPRARERPGA